MNQGIKDKLEQAAHDHAKQYRSQVSLEGMENISSDFKAGAQTILDNYHAYRLQSMEKYKNMVSANVRLGAENQRLREALEEAINIVHSLSEPIQELIDVLEGAYYE